MQPEEFITYIRRGLSEAKVHRADIELIVASLQLFIQSAGWRRASSMEPTQAANKFPIDGATSIWCSLPLNNEGEEESLKRAIVEDLKPEGPQETHIGITADKDGLIAYTAIKASSYIDDSGSINAIAGAAFGIAERLFAGHVSPFLEHCGLNLRADSMSSAKELNKRVIATTRKISEEDLDNFKAAAGVTVFQAVNQTLQSLTAVPVNVNPPVFISSSVKISIPAKFTRERIPSVEARIRTMRALSRLNLPILRSLYKDSFDTRARPQHRNNGGGYYKQR